MSDAAASFDYDAVLRVEVNEIFALELDGVDAAHRGFAHDEAGMLLAVLHALDPRGAPAGTFTYVAHVGARWAIAALRILAHRISRRLDPVLRPLALDEVGFDSCLDPFIVERRLLQIGCEA